LQYHKVSLSWFSVSAPSSPQLYRADDMLPGDKEVDELLAKNAQAFLFFVSFKFAAVLSGQLFFFLIRL
jgi:hypothetical protein